MAANENHKHEQAASDKRWDCHQSKHPHTPKALTCGFAPWQDSNLHLTD
jgi:hypothetical protein